MRVAIIKYQAGNVRSVIHALERLGIDPVLTDDPEQIRAADKVIFPGVGEASTTMHYLQQNGLDRLIPALQQPLLGICLGMQLMCAHSEEGNVDCLGIFSETVKRFPQSGAKVPHMGWNELENTGGKLFRTLRPGSYAYFVHSYYVDVGEHTAASCRYILPFSTALEKDNFFATQFHPEKSGEVGEVILKTFLEL